ncbi:Down syndrome cell adhesion molecule-like protein Dscam2 [Orchesella cincta]|uniref:Down syndrome cell adhesion molecule-like protein Dscam2 n=1 Tax=Orchesella cincta TaxID=48709 RepID=A0A1D2MGY8_ORCCI|nr:Down syndrome cell adhesion molecule-like protein Dscam2 [Orchesella cincta]
MTSTPELVNTFISQSLQPGPFITLKCSAVGNPIPKITWTIDNTPVHQNEQEYWAQQQYTRISIGSYQLHNYETVSHLNISGIQVENSGVYKCEASNLVGSSFHSARLNIYGSLIEFGCFLPRESRIFVKEMSALTLVAGQRALIPCHYGGYPVDKVGWQKDSRDIEALEGTTGFENDGKRTSGSERFTIFANGTLQIEKVNRDTDKGRYACVISNRKGEIASGSVDVNVMRSPVISPFRFDDDLREGQRTSASCNVISGDLPIDIIWFKDSSPIPNWLNVTENRVKFLSVLIFEELHHEHSGEFTCSVSNAAATVTQSATLNVKVPPKWTKEPESVKVILKSDHILPCSATGVPQPTINWYRESVVGRIKYAIKSNDKLLLREDGALKILQVGETDASNYICEAVNGVGSGISKSIRLDVIIPAKVSAPMTSIVVAEGLPALLKCEIRGDSPVQVSWKKGSVIMEPQHSSARLVQHQTIVDGNSSVLFAELRIDPSERADSGLYVCIASNQYGRDEDRINLEVKGRESPYGHFGSLLFLIEIPVKYCIFTARPDPPENFMVEEIGSRFIRLGWSVASSKESRVLVTSFLLQWKRSSTLSWESGQVYNRSVESSSTHAKLESLNPVTNYDIRVFASNDFGHGFPTEALTILTLPEAPSGSPTNVSGIPIGPRVVLVKWEPPDVSLQHGEILGYQVTANLQSPLGLGTNQKGNEQVIIDQKWGLQAELKELLPNSQYKISVKAYNSAGMGPLSPFLFIQTPEGAPDSPPIHLGCEALSPKSLQVQWEPPPFHLSNGQILGYKVIYLPLQAEEFGEKGEVKKTSNRETTLHGLRSFTSYSVRVLGYTHGGESNMSTPVTCRTEEDVPEEPADIKVVSLSSTSALVSWLPPTSSNGVITKYTVFWKSGESETVKEKQVVISSESNSEEDEFHLEIRRLRESLPYSVWVKASTSVGTGRATRTETFQLSSLLPARIASFASVKNKELGQPLRLACKSVGIPLPDVFWLKNDLPLPSHNLLRNGSLFINRIKGLDEGVYICRAQNEHGSDEIQHRVIISRPPSSVPIFVGYVTDSSIQIHWDPPEKAEPSLSAYVLQYQQQKDSLSLRDWVSTRMGPRLTSYLVENLLCGTQYSFRIFGENSVGKGEMSLVLSARTNGNLPEMPKLTEILDGNGTMIRIDLMRWSDGGCPITNFNIEYKKESSGNWLRIYRRDNSSRVFIIQTQLYSKYEIKIRVENDAGSVTKVFKVESYPDFFTNYAKVLERVEKEVGMNGSYVSLYTDPHVLVPIVSALICTFAVAICVLMLIKRKNQSRPEWKFKQSSSQQTWLSSSDAASKCAGGIGESVSGCPEAMSIYATLNSTKPIPMTIRDSTVRFQSFGQHDNYEAPNNAMTAEFTKRSRRKSCASSPLEEMCMQQAH